MKFQKAYEKVKFNFFIHRNKSIALQELLDESIFADLIFINELSKKTEESPTNFMKELLRDVQCPVVVVPNIVRTIDKVVLLYDGSPSSIHAIKSCRYLFDNVLNVPIEVFIVRNFFLEKKIFLFAIGQRLSVYEHFIQDD